MIFNSFEEQYEIQEREYLVLMSDESTWSMGVSSYTVAQAPFIACVDIETNELKHDEGRLTWPMKNKEERAGKYFNRFQKGCIYHIKARKHMDDTESKGMLSSRYKKLYVTVVLEEGVACKVLEEILAEQQKWDILMRDFAALKLTSLANKWQDEEDEKAPDISEKDFAGRINIESISITSGGSFSACFNDDDMFWGHTIMVDGSLKKRNEVCKYRRVVVNCQNHK